MEFEFDPSALVRTYFIQLQLSPALASQQHELANRRPHASTTIQSDMSISVRYPSSSWLNIQQVAVLDTEQVWD